MTSLESLVPSLSLCRQLQAAGFPQDTAMVWAEYEPGFAYGVETRDYLDPDGDVRCDSIAAPTAGELEEWLMVVFGFKKLLTSYTPDDPHPERRYMVLGSVHKEQTVQHAYGPTHVSALAALVLEVAG
jgi:hypothetical protein